MTFIDSSEQFELLLYYIKHKNFSLAEDSLLRLDPDHPILPPIKLCEDTLKELQKGCDDDNKLDQREEKLKKLFFLNLLSNLLSLKERGREKYQAMASDIENFLERHFEQFKELVPIEDIHEILQRPWMPVPVLVVHHGRREAMANWFFISFSSEDEKRYPRSFQVSNESKQAIDRAFKALKSLVKWTEKEIETPSNFSIFGLNSEEVKGSSLALPIGIGFYLLLNNSQTWPKGVYATGDVLEDGTLRAITHLEEKIAFFQNLKGADKAFFIFPPRSSGNVPLDPNQPFIPLASLEQACLAVSSAKELSDPCELTTQLGYLEDPEKILRNIEQVESFVLLAAIDNGKLNGFIPDKKKNLSRFKELVDALNSRQGVKNIAIPLSSLISADETRRLLEQELRKDFPDLFLVNQLARWTSLQRAVHNHFSHTDINPWIEIDKLLEEAEGSGRIEVDTQVKIQWQNHKVVAQFNNFYFSDKDELVIVFKEMVEQLGKDFHVGAAYGTLAQLHGFRREVDKCREFIRRGLESMPHGEIPYEHRRLKSNDIYCSLDNGEIDHAFKSLLAFIGEDICSDARDFLNPEVLQGTLEIISDEQKKNQPYLLQALWRYLADYLEQTGQAIPDSSALKDLINHIGEKYQEPLVKVHPWQLIFLNLGRVAKAFGMHEFANSLWHSSFVVCKAFEKSFFTIEVMALLPISYLYTSGALKDNNNEYIEFADYVLRCLRGDDYPDHSFNRGHFSGLLKQQDTLAALRYTFDNQSRLFPFYYR